MEALSGIEIISSPVKEESDESRGAEKMGKTG